MSFGFRQSAQKNREGRVFPFGVMPELARLLRSQRGLARESVPWVFHRNGERIRWFYERYNITDALDLRDGVAKQSRFLKAKHDLV